MPGSDPNHWLHRLTAEEWLSAADNELARSRAALVAKERRSGIAQARRAAGMALNALLCVAPNDAYGRSYMAHLETLAADAAAPEDARRAARALLDAPLQATLVQLGRGDDSAASEAAAIVAYCRARVI